MQNTTILVVPLHHIGHLYCIQKYVHQFQKVLSMLAQIWDHFIAQ